MADVYSFDKGEVIHGLPFDGYKEIDAVNFSTLKNIARSPAAYLRSKNEDSPTKSMDIGRAAHCKILEPELFEETYVMYDGTRRGTEWGIFRDDHSDKNILNRTEMNKVIGMAHAARVHPKAGVIFSDSSAMPEVTIVWTDPNTGIKCKARLDWVQNDCLVDLKTAKDPHPKHFSRSAENLRYFTQFAFYAHGYHVVTGDRLPMKCVAVGNSKPYEVVDYALDNSVMNHGNTEFVAMLELLRDCAEANSFPGINEDKTALLIAPDWSKPFGADESDPFADLE